LDSKRSYEILLASQSPRRSALMKELGITFRVVETEHSDEKYPAELSGKPAEREEAVEMLRLLSGDTHQVFTGVCLRSAEAQSSFFAVSDVTFSRLSSEEIEHYVDLYKPFDKAGAYGIQEWIGHIAVEKIVGSYFNVMGLPVQRVYSELKKFIGES